MNNHLVNAKIERARSGKPLRVLDLFAGCGGISLGFKSAGFEIVAAVESDPWAAASHGLNFHPNAPRHAVNRDISTLNAAELCRQLGLAKPQSTIDVIVGGPPCQAFARVGRSKLREVAEHPEAFRHDPRARLYSEYLEYVRDCVPLAVVMENVPDMLNHGGHNLAEEICEVLECKGYDCKYTLLNAAFFGVPQFRERMFLVAILKSLKAKFEFPKPDHWIELPRGYQGSRKVALKLVGRPTTQEGGKWFCKIDTPNSDLPNAVTAYKAIGDFPKIFARGELRSGSLRRGTRKLDRAIPYQHSNDLNSYAMKMRNWREYEGLDHLFDHVIRFLPRDYKLFARLAPGDQYPEAYKVALEMHKEKLIELENKGCRPQRGTDEWDSLQAKYVPPYDPEKFPNKWRKMERDKPVRTLLAHLGKDGYSHIHYDSTQARTISVREAARLQSFPDGFQFSGTMNHAFRQIGNAVPPLIALALANSLRKALEEATSQCDHQTEEAQ